MSLTKVLVDVCYIATVTVGSALLSAAQPVTTVFRVTPCPPPTGQRVYDNTPRLDTANHFLATSREILPKANPALPTQTPTQPTVVIQAKDSPVCRRAAKPVILTEASQATLSAPKVRGVKAFPVHTWAVTAPQRRVVQPIEGKGKSVCRTPTASQDCSAKQRESRCVEHSVPQRAKSPVTASDQPLSQRLVTMDTVLLDPPQPSPESPAPPTTIAPERTSA